MVVKVLDLFGGMGGLSLGFALGLREVEIDAYDIDRFAVDTYNYNLSRSGHWAWVKDLLKWDPTRDDYDLVMGGVPCQPYSVANQSSKSGTKHELYPTLPRFFDLVNKLRPKAFLMENVKGLISKKHKKLFLKELRKVSEDYVVKYKVLNSANYGVPQKRERLFTIGIRKDLSVTPSFPPITHGKEERNTLNGRIFKWVTVKEAIRDLLEVPPKTVSFTGKRSITDKVLEGTHRPFYTSDEPSYTVTSSGIHIYLDHELTSRGGWDNSKSDWGSRVIKVDEPSYTITEKHRSGQLVELLNDEWVKKHPPIDLNAPSNTIVSHTGKSVKKSNNSIIVNGKYRRLTVRECLRLQSFPDWWTFPSNVSVTRKYKLVGNAVPPILAYRLAVHLGKLMGWEVREPPLPDDWALPYFNRSFQDYQVS